MRLIALALLLAAAFSIPAVAQVHPSPGAGSVSPRIINFDAPILDASGKSVPDATKWPRDPKTHQPDKNADPDNVPRLTLGTVVAAVLNASDYDARGRPQPLSLVESARRGELILKAIKGGKVELSSEGVTEIKSPLPKYGSPIVTIRALALLGEPEPK